MRVDVTKMYHEAKLAEGEVVRYVDFTSLYPWVNAHSTYPTGHPVVLRKAPSEFRYVKHAYFGLSCIVLPPRDLFHPVLPYKCNDKLFPLCRTCAEEVAGAGWEHDESQRTLKGLWATPDVYEAMDCGYCIVTIHEVWHYRSKKQGLFANYVKKFLKIKQQASGFPDWCVTDADKQKYVDNYLEKEGIQLDLDKIEYNSPLRLLGKFMLNSFWGFLGRRLDKAETHLFTCRKSCRTIA